MLKLVSKYKSGEYFCVVATSDFHETLFLKPAANEINAFEVYLKNCICGMNKNIFLYLCFTLSFFLSHLEMKII